MNPVAEQRRALKRSLRAMAGPFSIRVHNYNNAYQSDFMPHNLGQDGYVVVERPYFEWVQKRFSNNPFAKVSKPYTAVEQDALGGIMAHLEQTLDVLHVSSPVRSTNSCVIAFKFK